MFLFCCSVLGSQRRWKDWVVIIRCEVRVGLISSFRHQPLDVLCTTSKNYVEAIFPSVLILCSTMAPNHAVCHQGRVKGGVAMLWDAAKWHVWHQPSSTKSAVAAYSFQLSCGMQVVQMAAVLLQIGQSISETSRQPRMPPRARGNSKGVQPQS